MKLNIKIELNRTQKIIFLMAFIVAISISVLWLFIYIPAQNEMREVKEGLSFLKSEIVRIERVAGGEKNLDIAYERFYKRYKDLEERIPTEERSTLSMLSTQADKMGIDVLGIKPGKARKSKIPIEIKGMAVSEMPISMNIRCDYIGLGEYLNVLRKELPTLITVNNISIDRPAKRDAVDLSVLLNITLFLLVEE